MARMYVIVMMVQTVRMKIKKRKTYFRKLLLAFHWQSIKHTVSQEKKHTDLYILVSRRLKKYSNPKKHSHFQNMFSILKNLGVKKLPKQIITIEYCTWVLSVTTEHINEFSTEFDHLMSEMSLLTPDSFIFTDSNINLLKLNFTPSATNLIENAMQYGFIQTIKRPVSLTKRYP